MHNLYSKKILIFKAVFCVMLAPLYLLISSLITVEDPFLYIIVSILPIGCLYTIPFWFSLVSFKRIRIEGLKKYILLDLLSCLIPAFFGMLFADIVYTLANGISASDGILTLLFTFEFILITSIFWLGYWIFNRIR